MCGCCVLDTTKRVEMGTELTADELEEVVLTWVSQQKHDELEKIYQVISLQCPPGIQGKRMKLLNGILAHLVTLDATESEEAIKNIYAAMGDAKIKVPLPKLEEENVATAEVKTSYVADQTVNKNTFSPSKLRQNSDSAHSVVDLVRFKELKIGGTILGKGDNRVSFASLKHVVENAEKLRYSQPMISAAIIKAISPTHKVKALLEAKRDMSVKDIMELLRNHYKKEDRSTVLTELRTGVQQAGDTALEFVTDLMCLRERVVELSKADNYPVDEESLWKDLFQSMFTGLRNPNIRSELRDLLNRPNQVKMDDNLLSKYVAEAEANELERNKKFLNAKAASANVVESEPPKQMPPKRDNPFEKIEELRIKQDSDISSLRADVAEVKSALLGSINNQVSGGGYGNNQVLWQPGGNLGGGCLQNTQNVNAGSRNTWQSGGRSFPMQYNNPVQLCIPAY